MRMRATVLSGLIRGGRMAGPSHAARGRVPIGPRKGPFGLCLRTCRWGIVPAMTGHDGETGPFAPIALEPDGGSDPERACVYYPPPSGPEHIEIAGDERVVVTGPAFSRVMFERAFAALTAGPNGLAAAPVEPSRPGRGGSAL